MSKKSFILLKIFGFCIVLFSVVYLIVSLQNSNTALANNQQAIINKLVKSERNEQCLFQNYIFSNKHINDSIGFVVSIDGNLDRLNDLYLQTDSVILICRISEYHCASCTQYAVNLAKSINYQRILFLAKHENKKSLINLSRSFNIDTNQIRGLEMELADAERLAFPYFLFVDGTNSIKAIYIPFESNGESDQYMLSVMLDELNDISHH